MKRSMKRKAFTIVEMVIVIAVIAILAAVMIPTISGMIQKANVSADTQFAASLNIQLAIWEGEIESESDLRDAINEYYGENFYETMEPKSAKYGYHYWYDIENRQVVLKNLEDLMPEVAPADVGGVTFSPSSLRSGLIAAYPNYFFMDHGENSEIGNFILAFESLGDPQDYEDTINDLVDYIDNPETDAYNKAFATALSGKVETTAIITEAGVFRFAFNANCSNITNVYISLYAEELQLMRVYLYEYDEELGKYVVSSGKDPGANPIASQSVTQIQIPSGVVIGVGGMPAITVQNAADGTYSGTTELLVNASNPEELKTIFLENATNCVIKLPNDARYLIEGDKIWSLPITRDGSGNIIGTPAVSGLGTNDTTDVDFDITYAGESEDVGTLPVYYYSTADTLYVACDQESVTLSLTGGFAPSMATWETDIVVEEGEEPLLTVNNGVVTLGTLPVHDGAADYEVQITATLRGTSETATITVVVVRPSVVKGTLTDATDIKNLELPTNSTFTLNYTGANYVLKDFVIDSYSATDPETNKCFVSIADGSFEFAAGTGTGEGDMFTVKDGTLTVVPENVSVDETQSLIVNYKVNGKVVMSERVTLKVQDNSASPFTVNHITPAVQMGATYLFRVGNGNTFTLDKLFNSDNPGDNITLSIYDASRTTGTTRFEINDKTGDLDATYESSLDSGNWNTETIQFSGTGVAIIEIVTPKGTATLAVEVVDGKNVTSANEWATDANLVLLSDITLSGQKTISGYTLYGNGQTISTSASFTSKNPLIALTNGTIDNVIIEGPVYPEVSLSGEKYYGPGIEAYGSSTISNSYISGFRSPVKTSSTSLTTTITNTTLSGGVYGNLDVDGGNVVLENVTTVQKLQTAQDGTTQVIGAGIVVASGATESGEITIKGYLNQYNWISSTEADKLSSDYKTAINSMLGEADYVHNVGGTDYVNTGIIFQGVRTKDIVDQRTNKADVPYSKINKTVLGVTGTIYTYNNSKGNVDSVTYGGYAPNTQTPILPTFSYTPTLTLPEGDYAASYSASNKTVSIGIPAGGSFTLDLKTGLSITKYETPCSYSTIKVNGTTISGTSYTFDKKGSYVITYTVEDNLIYDHLGKDSEDTVDREFTVMVEVTITNIPNATITTGSVSKSHFYRRTGAVDAVPSLGSWGDYSDYYAIVPIADSVTIVDYNEDGTSTTTTYTAAQFLANGKVTVTASGGYFTSANTTIINYGGYPYLHCGDIQDNRQAYTVTVTYSYVGYNGQMVTDTLTYSFTTSTSSTQITSTTAWS